MKIIDRGTVFSGTPQSRTANCCFTSLCRFSDGRLLASWRVGTAKDSPDGTIWISSSRDNGKSWDSPQEPFSAVIPGKPGTFAFGGKPGSLIFAPLTVLTGHKVLMGIMWIDRTNPQLPMFNPETEGLLPMRVLFSESADAGKTWSPAWAMDDAPYINMPLAICAPVLKMPDGRLACQFEVNKEYGDARPWRQAAALKFSTDHGRTWHGNVEVAQDPELRVRYWDQHHAVGPDGTCFAAFWTYDSTGLRDKTIHVSESTDSGRTWSPPRDTGIVGQLPYPIFLPDGRLVLVYIDRYNTRTIRLRVSSDKGRKFGQEELVIYQQPTGRGDPGVGTSNADYLKNQGLWTFGRLEGISDPSGDVWVIYYAGDLASTNIHWARLHV